MRIGAFGGTFNPIHLAHIHAANECMRHLALDKMLIIPTSAPPHKEAPELAWAHHRLAMCRLAIADEPGFAVCDYETERGGISYTCDTLRYLRGEHPGSDICLIMGADMFMTIQNWREPEEIFRLALLCACTREEGEYRKMLGHKTVLEAMGARCEIVGMKPLPMSSTEIRRRIKEGADISGYLHPRVWGYILEHGLYGGNTV